MDTNADAIFAFSITFMAISIHIPELAQNLSQAPVNDNSISKIEQIGKASLESFENKKLYKKFESELNELLSKYF